MQVPCSNLLWREHVSEQVVGGEDEAAQHGRLHEEKGLVDGPQKSGLEQHAYFFRPYPVFTASIRERERAPCTSHLSNAAL